MGTLRALGEAQTSPTSDWAIHVASVTTAVSGLVASHVFFSLPRLSYGPAVWLRSKGGGGHQRPIPKGKQVLVFEYKHPVGSSAALSTQGPQVSRSLPKLFCLPTLLPPAGPLEHFTPTDLDHPKPRLQAGPAATPSSKGYSRIRVLHS